MDRLEQIKKAVKNAKMDSLLFGQLLLDMEWLIGEVEDLKEENEKLIRVNKKHREVVVEYAIEKQSLKEELEKFTNSK